MCRFLVGIISLFSYLTVITANASTLFSQRPNSLDWWDTTARSAYFSYLFRESHNAGWLENIDASAFRGTVGSISGTRFLVYQEARLVAPISKNSCIRWRYLRHEDLASDSLLDCGEIEFKLPTKFIAGALSSAFTEKDNMDLGFILGFKSSPSQYLRFRYIIHRWLYNDRSNEKFPFSYQDYKLIAEGKYKVLPHKLLFESRFPLGEEMDLFLDAHFDLAWEQYFQTDDPHHRVVKIQKGESTGFKMRFYHLTGDGFWGLMGWTQRRIFNSQEDYYRLFTTSQDSLSFGGNLFYFKKTGVWEFESDLPILYYKETINQDTSTWNSSYKALAKRQSLEIYPQASVRRYFPYGIFAEFMSMLVYRNLRESGEWTSNNSVIQNPLKSSEVVASLIAPPAPLSNHPDKREEEHWNLRFGISAGMRFNVGHLDQPGGNLHKSSGELRLRVNQNLDRSWLGNFGGGNLLLILTW